MKTVVFFSGLTLTTQIDDGAPADRLVVRVHVHLNRDAVVRGDLVAPRRRDDDREARRADDHHGENPLQHPSSVSRPGKTGPIRAAGLGFVSGGGVERGLHDAWRVRGAEPAPARVERAAGATPAWERSRARRPRARRCATRPRIRRATSSAASAKGSWSASPSRNGVETKNRTSSSFAATRCSRCSWIRKPMIGTIAKTTRGGRTGDGVARDAANQLRGRRDDERRGRERGEDGDVLQVAVRRPLLRARARRIPTPLRGRAASQPPKAAATAAMQLCTDSRKKQSHSPGCLSTG